MSIFLKKIGILIISTFVIANLLSYISLWTLRQSSFYKPSFLVNAVSETNFDYIVLGASTGLTTLDTQVIDSLSGKKGINLAIDDTSISSQYLMLEHFLALGKTTKICVIAPSFTSFDTQIQSLNANDYRFLPYVDRSYVSDYFQSFSSVNAKLLSGSKYFPMLGVSYYNSEVFYPSLLSVFQPNRHNRFDTNGNYTYPVQDLMSGHIKNRQSIKLNFKNGALKKIQELCDRNNIELICYISPIKNIEIVSNTSDYEIINHSDVLIKTDYFFDNVHVNSLGRQVISERFANDLSSYFKD
ncbi:hypothetical protein [Psychroserpens ponticola]|uniref:SGNH/GDSL hydrolase family protein n=1 Tax=Psychroserpens ponticola TaxID=2932268 RepID=A0ABY7S254_9FLAO|nr:hypothetical protein [Psychroserpens ponticola]WCO02536.1 hypothetical protein MUN68_003345 [Psychroserpens ponticola]